MVLSSNLTLSALVRVTGTIIWRIIAELTEGLRGRGIHGKVGLAGCQGLFCRCWRINGGVVFQIVHIQRFLDDNNNHLRST